MKSVLALTAGFLCCWSFAASAQEVTVSGPLEIQGDISAQDNAEIGDKLYLSQFSLYKSPEVTVTGNLSGGQTDSASHGLGSKTFCALSKVKIVGEDGGSDDLGSCVVDGDMHNNWTLTATVGHRTDSVTCRAICLITSIHETHQ